MSLLGSCYFTIFFAENYTLFFLIKKKPLNNLHFRYFCFDGAYYDRFRSKSESLHCNKSASELKRYFLSYKIGLGTIKAGGGVADGFYREL